MQFNTVKFQDAATKTYLGSPTFVRLPDGDLLATHDYFGPGCPWNHEGEEHLASVYRSSDDGKTWTNMTHIAGAYWGNLFLHRGDVYHLGVSQRYGSIVIRRSEDSGNTWTHPADHKSGLLFRGGPLREPPNYHCAPMPVLEKDGRLYRAFEDCTPCVWGSGFQSLVVSADVDTDLLDATNWSMSNKIAFDPAWIPKSWGEVPVPGWLEGNVVETPEGELWNMLRFNSKPVVDKAAIVKIHDNGARIMFDPASGLIDFPGGMSKFTIRRDPETGLYLTLTNNNTDPEFPNQRNVLSLYCSADLLHWTHKQTLIEDDLSLSYDASMHLTGFQYVDWHIEGDDLLYIVRTAYDGSHNYHDSNRITFHEITDFRRLL